MKCWPGGRPLRGPVRCRPCRPPWKTSPPLERAIPAQLRWILERCLAKEREARYESTRDLARELANLRDHFSEPRRAPTIPLPSKSSRITIIQLWRLRRTAGAFCFPLR
jgi:hypothetical protein